MAVVISEIVTELVVGGQPPPTSAAAGGAAPADVEAIVRMATERVLEVLRREWDR
jgi:hypothetical protein